MKIERVVINNFRQYFGEQRVKFSQDPQQNVTVFHGVNGAGKTSFFLALNWCLYGEGVENIGQIISKEAVSRAEVGDQVMTKVSVTFLHDGQRYTASRQLKGIKQNNGSLLEEKRDIEFILMQTRSGGDSFRVSNPIGIINSILPSNVRTYFFFDGEKIDNFTRPDHASEVQFAIKQVLNLEVIERAKRHLDEVARDLRREFKSIATGELKDLVTRDEAARQKERELIERQSQLKQEIFAAERHIDDINQELRALEKVQELQSQHDLFTTQLKEREGEFQSLIGRIREVSSGGYLVLISGALVKAQALLDEKRQRGEIPSNIRQQFVQDLLDQQLCICGRPFVSYDAAHKHLSALLESSVPSSLEDDVLQTSGNLRALVTRVPELRQNLNELMAQKVHIQETLDRLYAQRDDIDRQMKGSPQVEVSKLARKREVYQQDIEGNHEQQIRGEVELEQIRHEIVELERQIAQQRKNEQREQLLSSKIELAQQSADAIGNVYDVFAENKRHQIEAQTRETFHALAWKGEHFQDVRLSSDYQLDVIDRYGLPMRPELSAGERQVLSLSFITAMAQVAEREAPIIMDTPFGRLSSAHRESITSRLPLLATQLALFVTDEELHGQALANLVPHIGAEYVLHFNPNTSCTTIEELHS